MHDLAENYLSAHKSSRLRRRKTTAILCILCFGAALTTAWQLRFVGITKSDLPCCGMEEHQHTPECYERRLICTLEETPPESSSDSSKEGHLHTDACYEEILICEKQEHEHTLLCYSDPNADIETPLQWESTLPDLSGMRWGEKAAAVARSQLGYRQSSKNFILAEDGVTAQGYTRYGQWFGSPYSDWNALFAGFCVNYAGIPEAAVPRDANASALFTRAKEMEILVAGNAAPNIGDILFLREEGTGNASRCAIVTGIFSEGENTAIEAIEGDVDGAVSTVHYLLNDSVCGYISLQKAYERAVSLGLAAPEEIPASPTPTESPTASPLPEEDLCSSEPLLPDDPQEDPEQSSALIQAAAEDEKPILNHPQWPEQWGMDLRSEAVDQNGNVTAPRVTLFTDPYFSAGIQGGSEYDYPKPKPDLGYLLSNYNFFVFDDVVATNHLVGSAAIQGNSYLTKNPGGSGGGYIPLSNKAPSYFKGRIIKLDGSYDGADLSRQEMDPAGLNLNISDSGHQTQVLWYSLQEGIARFPTYFGSANKANQDILIEGDNAANQKTVHFPDSSLPDGTAAFKSTADGSFAFSPYYYTDQYVEFEDFRTQLLGSDALHPEGIPVARPTDLSNVPLISDWQVTDDQLKKKGYQWMKNDEGQLKLFVRMGNVFNVDNLENVQIILYPWQGLEEFPGEPELSAQPADRANWLCTQKVNTVIQCDQEQVHLAISNAQGTVIPSVTYYTGDLKGPFNPRNTSNASLFNSQGVSTSSMLVLPNAKEVDVALSATHVVAPQASVYVPKSDYYGCFVCEDLRSCADHHILPYDTNSVFHPILCDLSKMIDTGTVDQNNDPVCRIPDGTEAETFRFKIRPYGFFRREATNDKSDLFSADAVPFPYKADFLLQQEYLVTNNKSTIDIEAFTADINRYFEQLIQNMNGAASAADKSLYKGHYIFEVSEVPDTPGFIPDPNKYYIGVELCHNEAWGYDSTSLRYQDILQKPVRFYGVENGQPVEQDSIVFYNRPISFIPELPSTGGMGLFPYWLLGTALICPFLLRLCRIRQKRN